MGTIPSMDVMIISVCVDVFQSSKQIFSWNCAARIPSVLTLNCNRLQAFGPNASNEFFANSNPIYFQSCILHEDSEQNQCAANGLRSSKPAFLSWRDA